jgi:hypothetical protein
LTGRLEWILGTVKSQWFPVKKGIGVETGEDLVRGRAAPRPRERVEEGGGVLDSDAVDIVENVKRTHLPMSGRGSARWIAPHSHARCPP